MRMPVTLARPIARRQAHEIDPEICEPAGIAQALPHAFGARRVELWWIERTFAFRHGGDVDFGHGAVPCHQRSSLPAGVIGYRLPRDEVISALFLDRAVPFTPSRVAPLRASCQQRGGLTSSSFSRCPGDGIA